MTNNYTNKHPLETNEKLSIAYALAFAEPTSKHQIQKKLTKSARYEPLLDQYKHYFVFTKRKDKRLGMHIQSKPEILIEYIKTKTNLTKNEEEQLLILLKDEDFKLSIKQGYIPLNTQSIVDIISIIFLGYFITKNYKEYKKKKGQEKLINIRTKRDKDIFYKTYIKIYNELLPVLNILKNSRKTIEIFENIGTKMGNKFKNQTIQKLLCLNPENAMTLLYCNIAFALAETYNYYK